MNEGMTRIKTELEVSAKHHRHHILDRRDVGILSMHLDSLEPTAPDICQWVRKESHDDTYTSGCGVIGNMVYYKYCPYCGKPVELNTAIANNGQ